MKTKFILLILMLSTSILYIYPQYIDSISIIAINNSGDSDTLLLGFAYGSTVGIDMQFGESDIISRPYSEPDVRSIQRTTVTSMGFWLVTCFGGSVYPFEQNIELKRDFREDELINHFVLKIFSEDYPVTLKYFYQGSAYFKAGYVGMPSCVYDENLNAIQNKSLWGFVTGTSDTLFILESSVPELLVSLHPQVHVDNIKEISTEEYFQIHPNPGMESIVINSFYNEDRLFKVFDIQGRKIVEFFIYASSDYHLDISGYSTGVYFIKNGYFVRKFIKI
jgi:hypothetical protein